MPTPDLRELQGLFWRSVTGAGLAPALLAVTERSATLEPAARLQVYADAYLSRLRDVLAEDFPRVAAILGPERFARLAREYLASRPSAHPSVRWLGRELPAAIAERTHLPPGLVDLARLEWTRLEVFDAPDCASVSADALRAVPPERWPGLRFAAIPALALLRADSPVHEVWGGSDAASPSSGPTFLRVWRAPDYRVYHAPMGARDAAALSRLMDGEPFAVICEAFDDLPALEGAEQATALLGRWLEDGIIACVT